LITGLCKEGRLIHGNILKITKYVISFYEPDSFINKNISFLRILKVEKKFSAMDDFYQRVYEVVKLVPSGRVTTYGAIAGYLGSAGSARMVGWAMNSSRKSPEYIPAHRVVNRDGLLTGKHHFDTPLAMKELLENEGIKITNDRIDNFERHFWDPCKNI
jgi:methylated-DNA-protein-cysteine methyltransferase related protein